ncbi:hypothetical protein [Streptacidiphilus pinicola]|uniref:hypothetical protein n=1 Tax=Streptacidiphilus pinicola TaxID=2219663 RepID=UPI001FB50EB9|nr:hypothetical protein [Streptacidiphilus pinicola]
MYSTPITSVPQVPTEAIPPLVLAGYQRATQALALRTPQCHLNWPLLAGIGKVESNHAGGGELQPDGTAVVPILGPELNGTQGNPAVRDTDHGALDGDVVWDRAVGPMQILPSVWRRWAATDRPGVAPNPQNVFDATMTAGELLCAAGGDLSTPSGLQRAVAAYHHPQGYAQAVLAWTALYAAESLTDPLPWPAQPPSWPLLPPGASSSPAAFPTAPAASTALPSAQATTPWAAPSSAHGSTGTSRPPGPPGGTPAPATRSARPSHSPVSGHAAPSSACACPPRSTASDHPRG